MIGDTQNGGRVDFSASAGSPFAHLGPEAAVAYDPRASVGEVEDANSKLLDIYKGAMTDVSPSFMSMISGVSRLQQSERHAEDIVAKAIRLRDGLGDPREGKAHTQSWGSDFGRGYFKWLPKRGVQLPILRAFSRRLEVFQAILRTRQRQVDRFSRPSRAADQMGWRLVMAEEEALPGAGLQDEIRWLSRVLECGGREFSPVKRRELHRQGMTQFLRHMVGDGLTLDLAAVELIGLNGAPGLDSWFVRPSETFALASPECGDKLASGDPIYAYQILNGRAEVPFGFAELALWIRNASTWSEENGYGYGEFEQSLDTLNNIIQAVSYTKQGLNENSVPRGILMAYGNYDVKTQEAFKAAWAAKVRGIQNQFGTPVLFSRGQQGAVQYLNTGQPFDEMAFAKWISFCMTIMGAICGVAPEEVGFEGFTAEKSALSGNDTSEKLAAAKDKGLYPLLKDAGQFISDELVTRFSPSLRFEFTGLDTENSEERWQEKLKTMTINEVRALYDMERHPLGWFGDLPFDQGMQSAEFSRVQAGATFGELRAMIGLSSYPSALLQAAPVNPSLGALYNMSVSIPADYGDGGEGGEGGDETNPEAGAVHKEVADRLDQLSSSDHPFESMDDFKARAGLAEAPGAES